MECGSIELMIRKPVEVLSQFMVQSIIYGSEIDTLKRLGVYDPNLMSTA